jgi:hypothetical protein
VKPIISITIVLLALFYVSCGRDLSNLKKIQEQTAGDFKVSVLNKDGSIKQGSGSFVVEFRNASNDELVKVGGVSSDAVMQMAGMPMTGETTVTNTDTPGIYEIEYNFTMKGNWKFTINFNNGLKVQFLLSVI